MEPKIEACRTPSASLAPSAARLCKSPGMTSEITEIPSYGKNALSVETVTSYA
jgi:hypothetical protein